MPKFNMDKLKGLELNDSEKEKSSSYKVGSGLLNDTSKDQNVEDDTIYLRRDQIERNEKNYYSINDIGGLAWSISIFGLIQPLHVKQTKDGRYRLLGGERRLTAIDKLIADPQIEDWTENSLIKCVEKDPATISLPLEEDLKEFLAIITTNKEARKYTDADRVMEIREWKRIIEALREQGVESIPYMDEEGKQTELVIKGEATRDILARTTGMSRGNINKVEKVEKHGSEALKEAILSGKTSIHTAHAMVDKLDEEQQDQLLQESQEEKVEITPELVRKRATKEHKPEIVSQERLKDDLKDIFKKLKKQEVHLDEKEQMRYDNCIKELKSLLYKKDVSGH